LKRFILVASLLFIWSTIITAQQCENPKAWYNSYNEIYFDNELPKDTIVKYKILDKQMAVTQSIDGKHFIIDLDPKYNLAARTAHTVLLHEMCHIETWNEKEEHGYQWIGCMKRLEKMNAYDNIWIDAYSKKLKTIQ